MRYFVNVSDETVEVELEPDGIRVGGEPVEADLAPIPGTRVRSLLLDGVSHRMVARRLGGGRWELHLPSGRVELEVVDERTRAIREMTDVVGAAAGPTPLTAPMPGLVVKVEVSEGDPVQPGQGLVIVEAMKMENELRAEASGVVSKIRVEAGQTVKKGDVLVEFDEPEV